MRIGKYPKILRISKLISRHKKISTYKNGSGRSIAKSVSFQDVDPDSQAT